MLRDRYGLALLGTVQSGFLAAVAAEMPRAPKLHLCSGFGVPPVKRALSEC